MFSRNKKKKLIPAHPVKLCDLAIVRSVFQNLHVRVGARSEWILHVAPQKLGGAAEISDETASGPKHANRADLTLQRLCR